jgi:cytochrome P450
MTADRAVPTVPGFDPLSQEFNANPDPVLVQARSECPVFYWPALDVWVVTRYDDIVAVTKDYKTFSSRAFRGVAPPPQFEGRVPKNLLATAFPCLDPPEHTISRKNANKAFTMKRVAQQEPAIREIAHELIDEFVADGRCDLMQQYCYPLSLRVILRMLGLPERDMALFRQWTEDMFSLMSPGPADDDSASDRPMGDEELEARYTRIAQAWEYYGKVVEDRRVNPRDDLISALIEAKDDDGKPALSSDFIIFHLIELTAAGNDTTANLMGNLVLFFDRSPAQLAEVKRDPSLLVNAVEEGLRRRPTSPQMYRITTEDVELGGVQIPARSVLCLSYGSGSNDEAHFSDPLRFDIHRENADEHLAFGHGRHFCLGAPLARLEARVGLDTLFERIPDVRVVADQTLEYIPVVTVQTLVSLHVEWR